MWECLQCAPATKFRRIVLYVLAACEFTLPKNAHKQQQRNVRLARLALVRVAPPS